MAQTNRITYLLQHLFTACLPINKRINMLTINAEIKKDGLRSDGTYNVKLRFTLDRKMRRLATSLFATSKDLTKELKIKQSSPIKK